ncbi:MAG: hypothetical protein ACJA18_001683 [Parvibaculaceae bacterium]|jgi:hypothetical protein
MRPKVIKIFNGGLSQSRLFLDRPPGIHGSG